MGSEGVLNRVNCRGLELAVVCLRMLVSVGKLGDNVWRVAIVAEDVWCGDCISAWVWLFKKLSESEYRYLGSVVTTQFAYI